MVSESLTASIDTLTVLMITLYKWLTKLICRLIHFSNNNEPMAFPQQKCNIPRLTCYHM